MKEETKDGRWVVELEMMKVGMKVPLMALKSADD